MRLMMQGGYERRAYLEGLPDSTPSPPKNPLLLYERKSV